MVKNALHNHHQPHQQQNKYWHVRSWRLFSFPLFFPPLEKWLKRLTYYQNGCQIISWPSIINWLTAAALAKTPGLILAGGALLSCPVAPTEPPPLSVMGLRALMSIWGGLYVQWPSSVSWWFWRWMLPLFSFFSCSQQIIVACSRCSFRFIPCRRPPAAIKSHPQISVSIIFSSPPSLIPYKVCVWALCFLSLFYLAAATFLWTWIIPDYT